MRTPTVTPYLDPSYVTEHPLEAADWVLNRLAVLGGEGEALHQQVAALKDAALLRGEYPELEAALVALPTGCVAQRLLAKHNGTGKYMAARLGWVHQGRTVNGSGLDDWHRLLDHCSRTAARCQAVARGKAKLRDGLAEYRTTMRESRRLWQAGDHDGAVRLACEAALRRAHVKLDDDVLAAGLDDALRKHRLAAGL